MQQYLPLAVLKLKLKNWLSKKLSQVATVPTACGIETIVVAGTMEQDEKVATVPTACGIETEELFDDEDEEDVGCNSTYRLRY